MNPDDYRAAMAHWPTGVSIVAVRDDGRVVATTVSALLSLSLHPPQVLLALAPNATVRPFLRAGTRFGISVLGAGQRRLATVFADPFPVGPDPFGTGEPPLVQDALIRLDCTVSSVVPGGDHAVVIAAVSDMHVGTGEPLIRWDRGWYRPTGD